MHQGLIDGPFVSHDLISTQESPVPLLKFQMAPILKILMSSGSKKGTQLYVFSQKSRKRTTSRFPNRAPMERDTHSQGICISLRSLIKIPLIRRPQERSTTPCSPNSGASMKADAHFQAFLNISFGVPSKGALPQGPLHGIPRRGMPRS